MRVGMNRQLVLKDQEIQCVPHACGDEPEQTVTSRPEFECSPCVWG